MLQLLRERRGLSPSELWEALDVTKQGAAFLLGPLLKVFSPVVWFVNIFVAVLLKILRIDPARGNEPQQLSTDIADFEQTAFYLNEQASSF